MFTPISTSSVKPDFKGKTLILPSISKGNVPQLACDLLIASLNLSHVGYLDSQYLIPVVGGREGGAKGISTPLEVFASTTTHVAIVQQRSPVLKAYKEEFVQSLLEEWIRKSEFDSVVILTGVDTTNRSDAQMQASTYYCPAANCPSHLGEKLGEVHGLAPFTSPSLPSYLKGEQEVTQIKEGAIPFIPSGGLTRRILQSVGPDWPIPVFALLRFVFEGDNRGDAGMFAALVNQVLNLKLKSIKEPESWKQGGLFGSSHDGSLFG